MTALNCASRWLPWGFTGVNASHCAAETGLHAKLCCSVQGSEIHCTRGEEQRCTSHLLWCIKRSKTAGFTQADKSKRQMLNSLPCSPTPPAPHLGSEPAEEKRAADCVKMSTARWFQQGSLYGLKQ